MKKEEFDAKLHIFRAPEYRGIVKKAIEYLAKTPTYLLPPSQKFEGSGVYALYYNGAFEAYSRYARVNSRKCVTPIYVGKAVPLGWRTARRSSRSDGTFLLRRLQEHAKSIDLVRNLQLEDFQCRFLILGGEELDLIVSIEAAMIRLFEPLWNCSIDGFGNHDPGSGRHGQAPSEWDILHPGRLWVQNLTGASIDVAEILRKIPK
jgi:hypothetical protein